MSIERTIRGKVGRAIGQFDMISEGDKILICYSGGKDSFALLKIIKIMQKISPVNFTINVLVIDPNFTNESFEKISKTLKEENVNFEIKKTRISKVIKEQYKKESNYCFLCSRLRRGVIYAYARENGYNKIALGHHLDDAIETFLLNTFFSNRISLLKPHYVNDKGDVSVIRPLIFCKEKEISKFINHFNFEPFNYSCPISNKNSRRFKMKKIIDDLEKNNPHIRDSAMKAFMNIDLNSIWEKKRK